ncbi:hypothetical protein [uncultured Pedobacter sp.]|uniref:hypothetical protein n=1 Tax=uncultured Pedobacter sp. TaxID=246139 RepID=UPI0025FC5766|nr:hypothetical protein [uncultured Pedobacter sp.]
MLKKKPLTIQSFSYYARVGNARKRKYRRDRNNYFYFKTWVESIILTIKKYYSAHKKAKSSAD